jgi:hypothetical protein
MRIDNRGGISIARDFRARPNRDRTPQTAEQIPAERSLVPVKNVVTGENRYVREPRTLAVFVTQLIAKERDALHTRQRNRAEPAEAVEAYRRMLNLSGVPNRYKARAY